MAIWFNEEITLQMIEAEAGRLPMMKNLGIELTELGDDYLRGTMVVDKRTRQPAGILHGGMSCVLGETLGSYAANLTLDMTKSYAVGAEINASHLRPVPSGIVTGTARPIKLGRTLQVWEILIENEQGKPNCIVRLTMAVVPASA